MEDILNILRNEARSSASMYGEYLYEKWSHEDWIRVLRGAAEDRTYGSLPLGMPQDEVQEAVRIAQDVAESAYRSEVARLKTCR